MISALTSRVGPRAFKRPIAIAIDVVLMLAATWIAFSARQEVFHRPNGWEWLPYLLAPCLALPVFAYFGLYRTIVRYSGVGTILAVGKGMLLYALLYAPVLLYLHLPGVPRTLGLLQPLLSLLFVSAWRIGVRLLYGGPGTRASRSARQKVAIYGAGSAGRRLLGALQNSLEMKVVAFIDDDRGLQASSINGVTIHAPEDIAPLAQRTGIEAVLLAIPSLGRSRRNEILRMLQQVGVHVRTLPGLFEMANGKVEASDLRELDAEDLLGRDPVPPDPALMALHTTGKVVLVTGAGGSIGSELCRQLMVFEPHAIVLVDHSEFALYTVHQELLRRQAMGTSTGTQVIPRLCSVRDERRLRSVMLENRPHIVYHAAAYKHVPMIEENIVEGVSNNVFGTWFAAQCALHAGVSEFVLISTDKAVRPTNVMGASKRFAEMVLQALAAEPDVSASSIRSTKFSMVRFGNVLGSSGSVVPLFRQQIRSGGPVTVTHPQATRYFMTIPEAAQLVVQAGAMARGGEVFVLDMGQPVRIIDLARRMIELSGSSVRDDEHPDGDIEITVTGLRPGEKLYEELLIGDNPLPTDHAQIMMARESHQPRVEVNRRLAELQMLVAEGDERGIVALLKRLVTGYAPNVRAESRPPRYLGPDGADEHRAAAPARAEAPTSRAVSLRRVGP